MSKATLKTEVRDTTKAKILWAHTEGFRKPFAIAILAMAVAYVFMFGAPLLATFAIDAIIVGPEFAPEPWIKQLGGLFSLSGDPTLLSYLLMATVGTIVLTAIAGVVLFFSGWF
ncbi:MAG: hypothetical protein AAF438_23775, partial [Pseudomonadota bacterium]